MVSLVSPSRHGEIEAWTRENADVLTLACIDCTFSGRVSADVAKETQLKCTKYDPARSPLVVADALRPVESNPVDPGFFLQLSAARRYTCEDQSSFACSLSLLSRFLTIRLPLWLAAAVA